MRTSMSSLVPLLIVIFLLAREGRAFPVYDMLGELVKPNVSYYIIPIEGGPLYPGSYGNESCPLLVVQEDYVTDFPPVTFVPADPQVQFINTSMNLNIKWLASPGTCGDSMVWRLYKRISEALFISTDGVEGNLSPDTIANWFTIDIAVKGGYIFKFCPSETGVTCSDLGIYVAEDNKKYLGLADQLQSFRILFDRGDPVMVS